MELIWSMRRNFGKFCAIVSIYCDEMRVSNRRVTRARE